MQSFDYISEKLGVSPTLDPFLGMCRTLRANLRTRRSSLPVKRWNSGLLKVALAKMG